jgi:hypothetical protein
MALTLPKDNELTKMIDTEIEHHGFIQLVSERTGRLIYLIAPETLEGFSQALTNDRLRTMVSESIADLKGGKGVSIDVTSP